MRSVRAHARYQCLSRRPAILLFPVSLLVQSLSELIRKFVRVGGRYGLAFLRSFCLSASIGKSSGVNAGSLLMSPSCGWHLQTWNAWSQGQLQANFNMLESQRQSAKEIAFIAVASPRGGGR
jgi:hypothetical protein